MKSKRLPPVVRLAASAGVKAPVESYLRAGLDPNATDPKDRTLLLLAAAGGSADVCRLLLESGADPSRRDADGNDALTVAIRNGNTDAATMLRAVEADLESSKISEDVVPGLDQWEALTEPPPPEDEPTVRAGAAELQNRISDHDPIDTDFDWSDVEIELPESATRRDGTYMLWLDEVRRLIDFGLTWGWVTDRQVDGVATESGGREDVDEVESRLRLVLGDVGIAVEDDPALAPIVDECWSVEGPDLSRDGIMDEAIVFVDHLSQTRDLRAYYMKDIQRMEAAVRTLREMRR